MKKTSTKASTKAFWKPDWSKAPTNTIGASFNGDGVYWFWSEKPSITGSQKHPGDLKWRSPTFGQGYTYGGVVIPIALKSRWKDSWLDKPSTI